MCQFFSFVTEPENYGGKRFYFDWRYRKVHLEDNNVDAHSYICKYFKLGEDKCNKYEYNPLTKKFIVDQINNNINDEIQVRKWVEEMDFQRIVKPLIIKPIINPLDLPKVADITSKHIKTLNKWASVRDSVRDSIWDSIRASVRASVGASVRDSIWDSIRDSVGASVWDSIWDSIRASIWDSVGASIWDSVGAYISSFFDVPYSNDYSNVILLWENGLVPSFNGKIWRLHSGKNAEVVYFMEK